MSIKLDLYKQIYLFLLSWIFKLIKIDPPFKLKPSTFYLKESNEIKKCFIIYNSTKYCLSNKKNEFPLHCKQRKMFKYFINPLFHLLWNSFFFLLFFHLNFVILHFSVISYNILRDVLLHTICTDHWITELCFTFLYVLYIKRYVYVWIVWFFFFLFVLFCLKHGGCVNGSENISIYMNI